MASHHNDVVFPEDLDDEDEEDDDDVVLGEPDDDEETDPSPSSSSALTTAATVTLAITSSGENAPIQAATATATPIVVSDDRKRQRIELIEEKKPLDDSRKLFQRLWTDEDQIGLLQGFLEYTTERGRGSSHHNDTALFYDQIKTKLQLDFNKNQLVEKLRRLKKKYRNVVNKIASGKDFSFKTPHDQATFEISHKIWSNAAPIAFDDDEINPNPNPNPNSGHSMPLKNAANSAEKRTTPSRKRSKRELNDGDNNNNNNNNDNNYDNNNNNCNNHNDNNCNLSRSRIQGLIEETVKSCLSPLLKEIVSSPFGARGFGVGGFALNSLPWSLNLNLNLGSGEVVDVKWRKQQILELEVYSKRLELVQDEIKAALNELR